MRMNITKPIGSGHKGICISYVLNNNRDNPSGKLNSVLLTLSTGLVLLDIIIYCYLISIHFTVGH